MISKQNCFGTTASGWDAHNATVVSFLLSSAQHPWRLCNSICWRWRVDIWQLQAVPAFRLLPRYHGWPIIAICHRPGRCLTAWFLHLVHIQPTGHHKRQWNIPVLWLLLLKHTKHWTSTHTHKTSASANIYWVPVNTSVRNCSCLMLVSWFQDFRTLLDVFDGQWTVVTGMSEWLQFGATSIEEKC